MKSFLSPPHTRTFRTWGAPSRAGAANWSRLRTQYSPLALWHLLSLDAPTVAALWMVFLARCAGISLPWSEPAAMFVAVWMIYAADRLLDARLLGASRRPPAGQNFALRADARRSPHIPLLTPGQAGRPDLKAEGQEADGQEAHGLEARHRFHHLHRTRFRILLGFASLALVPLLWNFGSRALRLYALLAAGLGAWLILIHAQPTTERRLRHLPKELAVGVFFPAAVCIPAWALAPQLRPDLLPAAALFAWLCTLNCLFLYAWEHPFAQAGAHWTTRWSIGHLALLALLLCGVGGLLALAPAGRGEPTSALIQQPALLRLPALACALSAALLLLLHRLRQRLTALHLRAAADLALLTPLLLLPLLGLRTL